MTWKRVEKILWNGRCGLFKTNYSSEFTIFNVSRYNAVEFQDGAVVDFQVEAVIGYETWGFAASWPYRILNGEFSGWSDSLKVTIDKDTTSSDTYATTIDSSPYPTLTTPTPTLPIAPSPTVPELAPLTLLPLLLFVPFLVVLLVRKRRLLW
jgi:hypothetical protein